MTKFNKNIMLRALVIIMAVMSGASMQTFAAESAIQILDAAAAKAKNAKSLKAAYTILADGHRQDGTLTISGDRFTIASPQIASWYDGKTQWTYSTQTGEVNITEPTAEELQQVNPFAIISSFRKHYKATLLKSAAGQKKIKLTAGNPKSDIKSVVITFNASTLYPSNIELTMSNQRVVNINVTAVAPAGAIPLSEFRFDPKKHPGIPVVDLR